jgi:hypothetical protein
MEGEQRYEEVVQNEPDLLAEDSLALADKRSTREKITTSAIIVVAFLGVIAGYWQLSQGLNVSKLLGKSMTQTIETPVAPIDFQKDTDGDGLTDYEEQFVYKTSPYLEDSDSDGVADKDEIDAGHDPNCPGTESCNTLLSTSDSGVVVDNTQSVGASQLSPDRLRELLRASGATEEQLATLSDEDLLALYQQAAAQSGGQFTSGVPVTTGSTAPAPATNNTDLAALGINSVADLQKLSGAQIRELLIKQGAPTDVLQQVSDDQLKQMFIAQIESKLKESQ